MVSTHLRLLYYFWYKFIVMAKAIDVANVFLRLSQPEVGDTISNLKLQKLLYYAQGFHLAMNDGNPLFDENITAWAYGPVVESVYRDFKQYGSGAIPVPEDIDTSMFSKDQLELIEEIYEVYGQFSALRLMQLTHSEKPWMETSRDSIISREVMRDFFITRINAN